MDGGSGDHVINFFYRIFLKIWRRKTKNRSTLAEVRIKNQVYFLKDRLY